ncbi:MAG: UDP-3-O-(3-hydroxymyristoyl)glucosamine N-acyltransferase [bacterium]
MIKHLNREFKEIFEKLKNKHELAYIKGNSAYIKRIQTVRYCEEHDLTFAYSKKDLNLLKEKKVTLVIIPQSLEQEDLSHLKNVVSTNNPLLLSKSIIESYILKNKNSRKKGVETSSYVHPSVTIPQSCYIGHHVVINENCHIGEHSIIEANTVIEKNCTIGHHCTLKSNSSISEDTIIGNHVFIDTNTSIGNDGFNYLREKDNTLTYIPHIGNVTIHDHVCIGANSSIDRGRLQNTIIGEGTKIDNQCQIGHNVEIGKHVIMCGCSGIGGSTIIEDNVTIAAKVGIVDNIRIAKNTIIAGRSCVRKTITESGTYAGDPCVKLTEYLKNCSLTKQVEKLRIKVTSLIAENDQNKQK